VSDLPSCFNECSGLLAAVAAEFGTEMHVMVCPEVLVVGAYEPFVARCPHGVLYVAEPTGEQITEWVRTRSP
jgi:hypothetical protein